MCVCVCVFVFVLSLQAQPTVMSAGGSASAGWGDLLVPQPASGSPMLQPQPAKGVSPEKVYILY